jgi:hypothetical protein
MYGEFLSSEKVEENVVWSSLKAAAERKVVGGECRNDPIYGLRFMRG